ncbi:YciI family protein [Streptomyces cinereospinus]|uniref:YciI family protein n=1 Tax=Streptomyces cinereospinus TaxID=285561 RepID=A0ABV5MXN8_9ACTN
MAFFVVTYTHPDTKRWNEHVAAHVDWLAERLDDGSLKASGPFLQTPLKSALLILTADSRQAAIDLIATDPFMSEGLITDCTVTEWDPIFGTYNSDSSMPTAG